MATIRVRVNPADNGEYVIYADPEDDTTPWVAQHIDGTYLGWERSARVAGWPEFALRIPRDAVNG